MILRLQKFRGSQIPPPSDRSPLTILYSFVPMDFQGYEFGIIFRFEATVPHHYQGCQL